MASDDDEFDSEYDVDNADTIDFKPPALPELSDKPMSHHGCCLALSAPLLNYLADLLPFPPCLTLSIGSGYGLLEALLLSNFPTLGIIGAEVQPSPNAYLPPASHRTVPGSRFLEPLAQDASTWLFIYPKRVGLVDEYIEIYGGGSVEQIIWAGPKADWEDYKGCFARSRHGTQWKIETTSANEVGGRAWELISVARKAG